MGGSKGIFRCVFWGGIKCYCKTDELGEGVDEIVLNCVCVFSPPSPWMDFGPQTRLQQLCPRRSPHLIEMGAYFKETPPPPGKISYLSVSRKKFPAT